MPRELRDQRRLRRRNDLRIRSQLVRRVLQEVTRLIGTLRQLRQHRLPVGVVEAEHCPHEPRVGTQLWRRLAEDAGRPFTAHGLDCRQQDVFLVLQLRRHFAVDGECTITRHREPRQQPLLRCGHEVRVRPQL